MTLKKNALIAILFTLTNVVLPSVAQASNHTPECLKVQAAKLDYERAKADYSSAINAANAARGTTGSVKAQSFMNKAKETSSLYFKLLSQAQKDCVASGKSKPKVK